MSEIIRSILWKGVYIVGSISTKLVSDPTKFYRFELSQTSKILSNPNQLNLVMMG